VAKQKKKDASKRRWKWRSPRFENIADAQDVGRELGMLKKRDGVVHPSAMVELARDPASALHPLIFVCDEEEATQRYWEIRARAVLQNIRIEKRTRRGIILERVYVCPMPSRKVGYFDADDIQEQELADLLLNQAMRGLRSWMERYQELSEKMPGLFKTLRRVLYEHERGSAAENSAAGPRSKAA